MVEDLAHWSVHPYSIAINWQAVFIELDLPSRSRWPGIQLPDLVEYFNAKVCTLSFARSPAAQDQAQT